MFGLKAMQIIRFGYRLIAICSLDQQLLGVIPLFMNMDAEKKSGRNPKRGYIRVSPGLPFDQGFEVISEEAAARRWHPSESVARPPQYLHVIFLFKPRPGGVKVTSGAPTGILLQLHAFHRGKN